MALQMHPGSFEIGEFNPNGDAIASDSFAQSLIPYGYGTRPCLAMVEGREYAGEITFGRICTTLHLDAFIRAESTH